MVPPRGLSLLRANAHPDPESQRPLGAAHALGQGRVPSGACPRASGEGCAGGEGLRVQVEW